MAKSKKRQIWRPGKSAAANARAVLPIRAAKFFRAGRKAVKSAGTPEVLHRFRLKVKKFRYTLELFRPCYGPGLEKRLAELKKMQDFLGALSDLDTTAGLLKTAAFRQLPERLKLKAYLETKAAAGTSEFVRYWNAEFDAEGHEQNWVDYLKRGSLRSAKAPPSSKQSRGQESDHAANTSDPPPRHAA